MEWNKIDKHPTEEGWYAINYSWGEEGIMDGAAYWNGQWQFAISFDLPVCWFSSDTFVSERAAEDWADVNNSDNH